MSGASSGNFNRVVERQMKSIIGQSTKNFDCIRAACPKAAVDG